MGGDIMGAPAAGSPPTTNASRVVALLFEVASTRPVPLGIDGEAVVLDPPVRFRTRPGTLRVRISPRHPGASPSAMQPDRFVDGLGALVAIASGRLPTSGPAARWPTQRRTIMGKFGKKLAKFANSPKGQKLKDKAMRKAKDPKTRAKLEKKFGRKK
jgi:hypothetical protein